MEILWDEPKRIANLEKHGLDFAEVSENFDFDTAVALRTKSSRVGRQRYRLLGMMYGDLLVAMIMSPLGTEAISIVSLRRANKEERKLYAS